MSWRKVIVAFIALAAFGALMDKNFGHHEPTIPPGDGTKPSKSPIRNVSYIPDFVEAAVRLKLRDPDSAVFGDMFAVGDRKIGDQYSGAVCGTVNAKNGFGGYNGQRSFVYLMMSYQAMIDPGVNNAQFPAKV